MAGIVYAQGKTICEATKPNDISVEYLYTPKPISGITLCEASRPNLITLEKIANRIYVQVLDQYGNPLKLAPVKIIWIRADGTEWAETFYTNMEGYISVSPPKDAVGAIIQSGNSSTQVQEPQTGGLYVLHPNMFIYLTVFDKDTGEPIGGAKVEVNGQVFFTDSSGQVRIPISEYGQYTVEIEGGYRYYSIKKVIDVQTDEFYLNISLPRRFVPIVR